jgi:hypothetical protein
MFIKAFSIYDKKNWFNTYNDIFKCNIFGNNVSQNIGWQPSVRIFFMLNDLLMNWNLTHTDIL